MNYRNLLILIFQFVFLYQGTSQNLEKVQVIVKKEADLKNGFFAYRLQINNNSDSILCIPHSMFFDLNETQDYPRELAIYSHTNDKDYFDLNRATGDTSRDPQFYPAPADLLLPRQKLDILISLKDTKKEKIFILEYVPLFELDYRKFLHEMKGNWLTKYKVIEKRTSFE